MESNHDSGPVTVITDLGETSYAPTTMADQEYSNDYFGHSMDEDSRSSVNVEWDNRPEVLFRRTFG